MDDLSNVTDVSVPGCWIITAEKMRTQIAWSQKSGHANCYFQKVSFSAEGSTKEQTVICVIDLFDERWPTKTVTNDVEYVVDLVVKTQGDYPIIYRDTEGYWDELKHRWSFFTCFHTLNTKDQKEAIFKVLARHTDTEKLKEIRS